MDATTLYYTFSTIAQTLAAAFAFVGAFVLFRLQNIEHQIEAHAEELLNRYYTDSDYVREVAYKYFNAKQWKKLIGGIQKNYIGIMINSSVNRERKRAQDKELKLTEQEIKKIEEETRKKAEKEFPIDYPPYDLIVTCLNEKEQLLESFKWAACYIVFTIILSVVFLPFSKILVSIPYYLGSVLTLILIIVLTAISILLSILLIFRTLGLKFTKTCGETAG